MDSGIGNSLLPQAPTPRQDGPITEEEVLEWSEQFEGALREDEEANSEWANQSGRRRVVVFTSAIVQALERSVDLLLKKSFREELSDLLFGEARLCGRGFVVDDASHGGPFLRRWRIIGVVPPTWDDRRWETPYPPQPRYTLLAPFHVPILSPTREEESPESRSVLDTLLGSPLYGRPRPPAPIAEPEVRSWAENLRAELHAAIEARGGWKPPNLRLSPDQWFYSMEQSIELMLDPAFRRDLTEICYGKTDFHDYGYGLEDGECRRFLRQMWGITDVTYPVWDGKSRHYLLFTPLSVPWTYWAPRGLAGPDRHFNTRLQLMHRDELNLHPHYLLTCSECRSPQGALVPLDWVEDAGPDPRTQVAGYLNEVGTKHPSSRSEVHQIAGRFSEEILGFGASHHSLPEVGSFQRSPESGPIAEILDWAMGLYDDPEFPNWNWLGEVMSKEQPRTGRRVQLLADLLGRLQCQICSGVDTLRYCPTFTYPVSVDLDPSAQAGEVKRLAKILRASKERVAADDLFRRLLIFPDELPPLRLAQVLKRAELRHEDWIRNSPKRLPNTRLIALWVAESLADWPSLCERLGYGRRRKARLEDLENEHRQLMEIERRLSHLRARDEGLTAQALEAKRLLETAEFAELAERLVKHFEEKLRDDLDQFRFRAKKIREARESVPVEDREAADTSRDGPRRPEPGSF